MKNNTELRQKLTNAIMKHGKKKTSEKILIKSLKLIQKMSKKNHKTLIKSSVINATPTFKINKQSNKRSKRKTETAVPAFIKKDSSRTVLSVNFLVSASFKNKSLKTFYRKLTQEVIDTSLQKSESIEQKTETQKQVLMQKRYLLKFRW
jgi:small subunit ribosomal protein S7